jgi:hypothetical protein
METENQAAARSVRFIVCIVRRNGIKSILSQRSFQTKRRAAHAANPRGPHDFALFSIVLEPTEVDRDEGQGASQEKTEEMEGGKSEILTSAVASGG